MPELPEVETSRRGIEPWVAGHTILRTVVRNGRLRWPVADEIVDLRDQLVLSVQRRAKYLLLELATGWIIIHLGMSGRLRVLPQPQPPQPVPLPQLVPPPQQELTAIGAGATGTA